MNIIHFRPLSINSTQSVTNWRCNNKAQVNDKTDQLIANLEQLLQARRLRKFKERYGS